MKIVVNNVAASSGGALTILKNFYNYLKDNEEQRGNEWIFLLNDYYFEETENIKIIILKDVKKNWFYRLKFDLYESKKIIRSLEPDVVFSLQNIITFGLKTPQVLYMHQSIPFQTEKNFSFLKPEERILAIYQHIIGALIKKSIKLADKVVVQTGWIQQAVVESTKISPQKVVIVPPPLEDVSNYIKPNQLISNNFFYPAAKSIYKNHKCIYEASSILINKGIQSFQVSLTIEDNKIYENINHIGDLPFDIVMEKYNTSVLLFPSYIETVGLPLVEARQMNTIILAADCLYSREILDNYENAYFFDPFNANALANLMEKVILKKIEQKPKSTSPDKKNIDSWHSVLNLIQEVGNEQL